MPRARAAKENSARSACPAVAGEPRRPTQPPLPDLPSFLTSHIDPFTGEDNSADVDAGTRGFITTRLPSMPVMSDLPADFDPETISRNAPCPCGSGEKFKHCHGALA